MGAKEREQEFERRQERAAQREREKMEEIAEQEKELARIEAMENALDVTKQDNMGGFYRHLYRQTFGEEKGQKAHIKVEETEEQKAARVREELKKLKVEEGDVKVKQEEGAE